MNSITREVLTEKAEFFVMINYNVSLGDNWYSQKDEHFHHLTKFKVKNCRDNDELVEKYEFQLASLGKYDYDKVYIITEGPEINFVILKHHCIK